MMELLTKLEHTLQAKNAQLLQRLNGGLANDDIIQAFAEVELRPTPEVMALYHWRNGTADYDKLVLSQASIMPLAVFNPLERAVFEYQTYCLDDFYWPKSFFPILSSGAGDFYLVNLDNDRYEVGSIYMYSPALQVIEPELVFDSLEILFTGMIQCYEQGIFVYTDNNGLTSLRGKASIYRTLNKKSTYWD